MLDPIYQLKVYPVVTPPTFAEALPEFAGTQFASVVVTVTAGFTV